MNEIEKSRITKIVDLHNEKGLIQFSENRIRVISQRWRLQNKQIKALRL